MLRNMFFTAGLFVTLWGVTFLFVDQIVLNVRDDSIRGQGFRGLFTFANPRRQKVFDPPDWAAFSLLSVGAVTMLYSIALPRRQPQK